MAKHPIVFVRRLGPIAQVQPVIAMTPSVFAAGPAGINYVQRYLAIRLPGGWRII